MQRKVGSGCDDAEHFVEACGTQSGCGSTSFEPHLRVVLASVDTARSVKTCGFEHRRTDGHFVAEDVAAGDLGAFTIGGWAMPICLPRPIGSL